MRWGKSRVAILAFSVVPGIQFNAAAQDRSGALSPEEIAKREAIERELHSIAAIERKQMIPMRDGKRMATDVYRPKDTSKKYPAIFVCIRGGFSCLQKRELSGLEGVGRRHFPRKGATPATPLYGL
jgi:hypothetical protein